MKRYAQISKAEQAKSIQATLPGNDPVSDVLNFVCKLIRFRGKFGTICLILIGLRKNRIECDMLDGSQKRF